MKLEKDLQFIVGDKNFMKLNLGSVLVSVSINPQHEHINNWDFKYPVLWVRAPAALGGSPEAPEHLPEQPEHPGLDGNTRPCILPLPHFLTGFLLARIKQQNKSDRFPLGLERVSLDA